MISNHEEDEFIAVRVQDPRIQNEGSWNSYVDYKIFLHTNSRAFTAKTSCVRRRYSEFAWLKKKLQKNAGLVPVPDLPRKSLFSFSNEDFLEGRRRGLQAFLDKVVHMTVCLSDSQLHLFLQTQLPVGHIQDCVQGHTPYTVTDAILTYASSNQGFAQAQEDDANKESSLTISYESMESPAPHQPCPQTQETLKPEFLSCGDSDLPQGSAPLCDSASVELQQNGKSSLKVPRKNNRVEGCNTPTVSFFLGEGQDESGSLSPSERSCRMQTSAEVHTPMWAGSEVDCGGSGSLEGACSLREEGVATLDTGEHTGARPDAETDQQGDSEEANVESKPETEKCVNCVATVDFKNTDIESQVDVLEDECPEMQVLENQVIPDDADDDLDHIGGTEGHDADVGFSEAIVNSNMHQEPDEEKGANSESEGEALPDSKTPEDSNDTHSVPRLETGGGDAAQQPAAQEPDLVATKYESDEDSHSPPSSTGSIVCVSDDESACDEAMDLIQAESVYTKTSCEEVLLWSEVEASSRSILDLHLNGSPAEKGGVSTREDGEELQHKADIKNLCNSQDFNSAVADGELTENGDFSILATIRSDGLTDEKCTD